MKIGIIGLGLIGGSMAKDLRVRRFASSIYGVEANKMHAQLALENGMVDQIMELESVVKCVDLILLATPVNVSLDLLPFILDHIDEHVVVMDVGSTKEEICKLVFNHKNRGQFIAAHPIAGTENKGPLAAVSGLFDHKVGIICNGEQSSERANAIAIKVFSILRMEIVFTNAKDHDLHLAYVSHLSHVISFALSNCVLDLEEDRSKIVELAGSGFASTVRLAKSSSEMWTPIFEQNRDNVLIALESYIEKLNDFKSLLEEKKYNEVHDYIAKANAIKNVLNKRLLIKQL